MKNYKMKVQYDGTRYNGWQRQGNTKNTIQERFETVLSRMCDRPVEVFASGRTDAGVHAAGQIANFHCDTDKTCEEILEYLNHYLPEDIAVLAIAEAEERFHSRLNAVSKAYEYRIAVKKADVFCRKYVYVTDKEPDVEKMQAAAKLLLGKHDFKGFSAVKRTNKSTLRTIFDIAVVKEDGLIKIRIHGSGFLHHMVRILAGTLLEIGLGEREEDAIYKVLTTGNRADAGITLPPCGLTLLNVFYQ